MGAETNLNVLLGSMDAELRPGRYVFSTVPGRTAVPDIDTLATVVEPEGLSLVVTQEDADRTGLPYDFIAGWITLRVHSSLHAVGLTAAVSTALAAIGISCNVIAGHHHDHLLVPLDRAEHALTTLRHLAATAGSTPAR